MDTEKALYRNWPVAIHACLLDERQFAGDTPDEVLSVWRGAAFIVNNNSGQGQAETTPRAVATRPQKGFDVIESERFIPCAFRNSYRKTSGQQRQAKELLETHIYTLFSFFSCFPLCNRVEAGHGEYPATPPEYVWDIAVIYITRATVKPASRAGWTTLKLEKRKSPIVRNA